MPMLEPLPFNNVITQRDLDLQRPSSRKMIKTVASGRGALRADCAGG